MYFCAAAVWWESGRGNCLERAEAGQIGLLRVENLLRKWKKGIKGAEASELEKEADWVGESNCWQQKVEMRRSQIK